ncbi:hypothetical protein ABWJ92_06355 [Streptomyces sp. NPDC000609]|uniref:hypothetical protein n=1 Tax=Streptomyces sp. NPDC000609 TaxID=3160957 RepID=UPI003395780A
MSVSGVGWSWLLDDVIRVVFSWDEEPAPAARHLDGVLRRVTPHELIRLESGYRSRRYSLGALGRGALAPAAVPDTTAIGALGGLADLGNARDVPRILDFTTHPKARVRAEAWRALSILAPEEVSRRADRLATDPSNKVRRHLPAPPAD